ncbi:translocation/assembly module TamB domain-containing protein [Thiolinea disciformis]|uniref:translocation/assembly module TamB domain-containing protein n=1 Tax=Thiolinea disciformis TaxID=125614 RepID=UPI00047592EA|nr:translocation/assembly module TamB domain-containing protein [Thiolinea disciformis]
MNKWFRYLIVHPLIALVVVFLLLAGGIVVLSVTQTGSGLIVRTAERVVPGLTVEGVQGSLLDSIQAQGFVWEDKDKGIKVAANQVNVKANIEKRWPAHFTVKNLEIEQLTINLPQGNDGPLVIPDIHIPNLAVQQAKVKELIIVKQDLTLHFKDVLLNAVHENGTLKLSELSGELVDTGGNLKLSFNGEMKLTQPHPFSLSGSAKSINAGIGTGALALNANGELPHYQVEVKGDWQYPTYPLYQIQAKGKGDFDKIALDSVNLLGAAGNIDASGTLAWTPTLAWDIQAKGQNLKPEIFSPEAIGLLNTELITQGRLEPSGPVVHLHITDVSGQVHDHPIKASFEGDLANQALVVKALDALIGSNRLKATGSVEQDLSVNWELDAPKLAELAPELKGQLAGRGKLSGKIDGSQFALSITELTGKVQNYPVLAQGGLSLKDNVLSTQALQVNVGDNRIQLDGVADESQGINWVLEAKNLSQLAPELKGNLKGAGNAQGLMDGSRLALQIKELQGAVQGYPIKATGQVRLADKLLSTQDLQVDIGDNRIQLNGVADEKQGINWQLDAKNLSQLQAGLTGHLKGSGNAQGLLDGSRVALKIEQLEGKFKGQALSGTGEVRLRDKVISAKQLQLSLGDNRIQLDGVADEAKGLDWKLDARNLSQVNPQVRGKLVGTGNAQLLLDGSRVNLKIAELAGSLQGRSLSAQGELRLRDQVISAKDLKLNVGSNFVQLNGVADEAKGVDWVIDAKNLSELTPQLKGSLKGSGNAQGLVDGSRGALRIDTLSGSLQGHALSAQGELRLRDQLLSAKNLLVNFGSNTLQLNGVADEAKGIDWVIDAKNLSEIDPQLQGSVKGSGNAQGVLDGSRVALRINDLAGQVQGYPLAATGQVKLRDKQISAQNLIVDVGQNRIRLNGNAGQTVGVDWDVDARNFTQLYPSLRGSLQGNGRFNGTIDGKNFELAIARINGQIEGRPLSATGTIQVAGQKINVQNLSVMAGDNRLEASGQASEPFNLTWRINAPNLAQAWPGLAGSLQGEGVVRGILSQPDVQGHLQGANLAYQDLRLGKLDVQARQNAGQYDLRGTASNLQQGSNLLNALDFVVQGSLQNHSLNLGLTHKEGKADLRATGSLQGQLWRGSLQSLSLRDTPAGNWQLTNPITLSLSPNTFNSSEACLANQQNARLCAKTDWSAQAGLQANGSLQQVPLNMAKPFIPSNVQVAGVVNGTYQVSQRGGRLSGRADLQFPDSTVTLGSNGRLEVLNYTNARANVQLNDQTAVLDAQLDIVGRGQLRANGRMNLAQGNQPARVDGQLTLNIPDIKWLEQLSPQVDDLKGQITADVRVNGTLNNPQIMGQANLKDASLYLPETGARFEAVNLAVVPQGKRLNLKGSLRAGDGLLNATGFLDLAQLPNWQADVRLQGNHLLLMNTYEVQAQASPDLRILATPKVVDITGTVKIPEGSINLRQLPTNAKKRSDDIVIVRKGQPIDGEAKGKLGTGGLNSKDSGIEIRPEVIVELGEKVRLNAFGLDARLAGRMRLLMNKQDIVGEGSLNVVEGVYNSYGQDLKIERGRVIFNGPLDNPGLDVRATRKIEDENLTVGLTLGGTIQQPESVLFSNPSQSQSDTLSYLVTGRALSGVSSGNQSELLMKAVTALGVSGGETLAQGIGSKLGLDDVNIKANNGDYKQSELALGKRLGPKLYVKYMVGLFDSLQKAAVTYEFNKRLRLEAASGAEDQSFDLIYKIDSNKGPFGK